MKADYPAAGVCMLGREGEFSVLTSAVLTSPDSVETVSHPP